MRLSVVTVSILTFAFVMHWHVTAVAGGPSPATELQTGEIKNYALLIGIDDYKNLSATQQLEGCKNDVEAVSKLLVDHSGFDDKDIVRLLNEKATNKNIISELDRLLKRVQSCNEAGNAAHVVLTFSGHGSQVMDQLTGPLRDEPSFFDQTIVPHDAHHVGGENDIRDDDLRNWASDIGRNSSNRLFVLLDCCHSGTGLRSIKRFRRLDRKYSRPNPDDFAPIASTAHLPNNVAVLSACDASELEPEFVVGEQSHGLLTYWVCRLVNETAGKSRLDLATVPHLLKWKYQHDANMMLPPEPQLEMSVSMSTESLLFIRSDVNKRLTTLTIDNDGARLHAGLLDGVVVGQTYPVFKTEQGLDSQRLGTIRITKASVSTAAGEITDSNVQPGTFFCNLSDPSGSSKIKIAIASDVAGEEFGRLLTEIQHPLVQWVQTDGNALKSNSQSTSSCRYHARLNGDSLRIFRSDGSSQADRSDLGCSRSIPRDANFATAVADALQSILAADLLESMAARQAQQVIREGHSPAGFRVQVENGVVENGSFNFHPVPSHDSGVPLLKTGDVYALNIRHRRALTEDIFATVVHIDPSFDVQLMCPDEFTIESRDKQRVAMPDGLRTQLLVCNGDSLLPAGHADHRAVEHGLNLAIVIVSSEPPNLTQMMNFLNFDGRKKSVGRSSDGFEIEFGAKNPRAKSITKSTNKKSAQRAPWWDAKIVRWITN